MISIEFDRLSGMGVTGNKDYFGGGRDAACFSMTSKMYWSAKGDRSRWCLQRPLARSNERSIGTWSMPTSYHR